MKKLFWCILLFFSGCQAQEPEKNVIPGAYQLDEYLDRLKGKRVGLVINHTSTIEGRLLADT
jgi:uncharacterized protein YbbC (DUF1343 family)